MASVKIGYYDCEPRRRFDKDFPMYCMFCQMRDKYRRETLERHWRKLVDIRARQLFWY
jgi:hypothetical protein